MFDLKTIKEILKKDFDSPSFGKVRSLIREISKKNPYLKNTDKFIQWDEQCYLNYPILYLASICLYQYSREKGCDTFLFVTRDCCHWYRIFKKLFPEMASKVHYFDSSRVMFEKACNGSNTYYNNYLESLTSSGLDRAIYVDVHGTGNHMLEYFNKLNKSKHTPHLFLLSSTYKDHRGFERFSAQHRKKGKLFCLAFDTRGSPIEMLNYDKIGTLQDYNQKGPVRDHPEYDIKLLDPSHNCMRDLIDKTSNADLAVKVVKFEELNKIVQNLFDIIKSNLPVIEKKIRHVSKHRNKKF